MNRTTNYKDVREVKIQRQPSGNILIEFAHEAAQERPDGISWISQSISLEPQEGDKNFTACVGFSLNKPSKGDDESRTVQPYREELPPGICPICEGGDCDATYGGDPIHVRCLDDFFYEVRDAESSYFSKWVRKFVASFER